nr:reverse transcriptase domain-containing protein [Tanacetum cinerariifolium]
MRTRNSYFLNNSSVTFPRRRNKRRGPNIVKPELRTIVEVAPMTDNQTMEELLQAPTEGYGEAIVILKINADNFKIKMNLLQLVQANPYHGFERENPHTHIINFKRITSTLKFRDVSNDVIKLMMFPYSLEGSAKVWYDKELPSSILTWDDLNDQDSLNATAGGNLLSKTTKEALRIIENKSKVRYLRNKPNVSRMNTTSRENASKTDDRIDNLADQISTLIDIVSMNVVTPARVKAVVESCVTCGCNHAYYNCDATNNNQLSVCVATGTYNQVGPQNHASNYMAPPGFAPVQNNSQNSPEPDVLKTLPKPSIPYTSRLNDQKLREKATNQMEKFFQIFQDFHFDISFADALLLMPKFASMIKRRSFLRTGRALIDVYGEEITLWVNDEAVTFNLNQTMRYSSTYDDIPVNRIDVIDVAREEYAQEMLVKEKSLIEEPSELELKDLPSHLEYAYLEGADKLPVIIAKDLKVDEKYDPFGLCNAPGTFQRCMMAIFHDMIEKSMKVFMDDFSISGDSFPSCLSHLDTMLQWCEDTNLVLNWEKCHFMVKEGIVLGHKISKNRLEVDRAKVDVIAKLPHPTTVKDCIDAFENLKKKLTEAPILVVHDWNLSFELMYDASDFAIGAVLGQRKTKTVGENRASWSEKLEDALWAFRTAYKTPIGCTPYKLDYGKSCDHRKLQLNELNELRDQAYENAFIYKEKTKKLHDFKIKNRIFNVGDRVLLFNSRLKIFSRKLKTCWSGPFTITEVFPYGTVKMSQPEGPNFKVNGHRVKRYFGGDIPQLVDNLSKHTIEHSRHFNSIYDDDDDYEESTFPLKEINSQIPLSIEITPVLPKDKVKIYSNPLFEFDDEYISSDVNPIFNEDECFDPGGNVDEINAFDIPLDFEDDYYDSKGDVLCLESLLSDDTTPNLLLEVFLDRDPRNLSKINDLKIMVKVFDHRILEKKFSPPYVSLPFNDRHYLFLTYVILIFLPYFTYPVDSHFLLSSGSEDTIFDHGISAFHFLAPVASHRSGTFMCFNVYPNILNESSMEIFSST